MYSVLTMCPASKQSISLRDRVKVQVYFRWVDKLSRKAIWPSTFSSSHWMTRNVRENLWELCLSLTSQRKVFLFVCLVSFWWTVIWISKNISEPRRPPHFFLTTGWEKDSYILSPHFTFQIGETLISQILYFGNKVVKLPFRMAVLGLVLFLKDRSNYLTFLLN